MDKIKLKKCLIELEHQYLERADEFFEDFLSEDAPDRTEAVDDEGQSHRSENSDLSNRLDDQLHEHEEHLALIEGLDFSPADSIRPGAVIKVNNRYMVVAVSKSKFSFDGQDFIGISTDAPIYQCIHGKKAGDECQFNNTKFKIQEVH